MHSSGKKSVRADYPSLSNCRTSAKWQEDKNEFYFVFYTYFLVLPKKFGTKSQAKEPPFTGRFASYLKLFTSLPMRRVNKRETSMGRMLHVKNAFLKIT